MSGSTSKKVVAYRFDREPVEGYVNPQQWLGASGIEIMRPEGALTVIPYIDLKVVCFVKDFDGPDWSAERRRFAARPKTEGLWVRAVFRDYDLIEAVLANDLLQWDPLGYLVAPPDANSNNQRLFLPRAALRDFRVLGVVGSPARKPAPEPKEQIRLFE